jgi:hypothetical protein
VRAANRETDKYSRPGSLNLGPVKTRVASDEKWQPSERDISIRQDEKWKTLWFNFLLSCIWGSPQQEKLQKLLLCGMGQITTLLNAPS